MKKVFLSLTLFLFIFNSGILKAIEFEELSADKKFEIYKESCDQGQMANCYQEAVWYKINQRLDNQETNKIRSEIESLKNKKKELKKINPDAVLEEEDAANLKAAVFSLNEDQQKKMANSRSTTLLETACKSGETAACREKEGKNEETGSGLLYYTALILIGLAVFLISKTIFQDEDTFQAQEKLDESNKLDEIAKHGTILRYSRPFFKRYFSPIVSGMKNKKNLKEKYRRVLAAAGLTNILTPEDFFAFKLFLIIGFPIIFIALKAFLSADWSLTLIPVLALVGFFYPDLWIKGKIEARQKEVIMSMPFCVDMLALSVEAGLDFVAAMAKVIEKAKVNALTEEFENVIREIKIGASRAEALRNLAWRIDLIQISSFSATLIAADSVGASIGPILKALAVEIRQKKSTEVEKAGATAATKILFPMMFLIIPSVLLIIFAPIVLEMMK
ncbi:MAG: type II secretion system F family protein [Bacteriovorax sp.]|nr:type II secretion system F family protein [Bacteriovorax sp.]